MSRIGCSLPNQSIQSDDTHNHVDNQFDIESPAASPTIKRQLSFISSSSDRIMQMALNRFIKAPLTPSRSPSDSPRIDYHRYLNLHTVNLLHPSPRSNSPPHPPVEEEGDIILLELSPASAVIIYLTHKHASEILSTGVPAGWERYVLFQTLPLADTEGFFDGSGYFLGYDVRAERLFARFFQHLPKMEEEVGSFWPDGFDSLSFSQSELEGVLTNSIVRPETAKEAEQDGTVGNVDHLETDWLYGIPCLTSTKPLTSRPSQLLDPRFRPIEPIDMGMSMILLLLLGEFLLALPRAFNIPTPAAEKLHAVTEEYRNLLERASVAMWLPRNPRQHDPLPVLPSTPCTCTTPRVRRNEAIAAICTPSAQDNDRKKGWRVSDPDVTTDMTAVGKSKSKSRPMSGSGLEELYARGSCVKGVVVTRAKKIRDLRLEAGERMQEGGWLVEDGFW
jgi:hypothetical protein